MSAAGRVDRNRATAVDNIVREADGGSPSASEHTQVLRINEVLLSNEKEFEILNRRLEEACERLKRADRSEGSSAESGLQGQRKAVIDAAIACVEKACSRLVLLIESQATIKILGDAKPREGLPLAVQIKILEVQLSSVKEILEHFATERDCRAGPLLQAEKKLKVIRSDVVFDNEGRYRKDTLAGLQKQVDDWGTPKAVEKLETYIERVKEKFPSLGETAKVPDFEGKEALAKAAGVAGKNFSLKDLEKMLDSRKKGYRDALKAKQEEILKLENEAFLCMSSLKHSLDTGSSIEIKGCVFTAVDAFVVLERFPRAARFLSICNARLQKELAALQVRVNEVAVVKAEVVMQQRPLRAIETGSMDSTPIFKPVDASTVSPENSPPKSNPESSALRRYGRYILAALVVLAVFRARSLFSPILLKISELRFIRRLFHGSQSVLPM